MEYLSSKNMSHLVRRTKKCCTKLLRKITFNDNLSCPSATKPSQSTIYAQQKNHQPSGRRKIAPSPQHSSGILFARSSELNTNLDGLSLDDEDDINMNTFSSNKNFRFDNNIKNCFRIQKQNYVPQENEDDKNKSTNNNFSSSSSSSSDVKNSIFVDEEIIFTENKIYISATERNLKQCESNNKVYKKPFDAIGGSSTNFNSISLSPIDGNGKCCGKLGFNDSLCASEQIVFEKVKYDKNKKYLQPPSPSNSSEHSTTSCELNQYLDNCYSRSTQTNRLSTYDNVDYEWAGNDENGNSSNYTNNFNFSIKGQHQKQTPNSINDKHNELYLKNSDSWKFFNKQYLQNSKFFDNHKIIKNNTIHYETVSDSRRTSVSTLDTWVDDESFDNSFNEELEKRCPSVPSSVRNYSR
ncbi:putative uncharacterized protein DDB_G0287457 [Bradysia coprophila]|uniref:putative uncharacterized protein DDB_G0287457 n=1 Tax=Bradysia coprophila TaxID=38358 RepID=UPI00187DCFB0|nr:putative uncharacterized protein DDB_G0287457 [Bradysia coprophila]XP_037042847.1 putative uncharacterized protein DDB_G0287457 [Bradysia coprophila]